MRVVKHDLEELVITQSGTFIITLTVIFIHYEQQYCTVNHRKGGSCFDYHVTSDHTLLFVLCVLEIIFVTIRVF